MLNFAEQTGSGDVIVVWSFLPAQQYLGYITLTGTYICHSLLLRGEPYHDDSTMTPLISKVKHLRDQLVLRWGTTLES